jgi:hypothetical protein
LCGVLRGLQTGSDGDIAAELQHYCSHCCRGQALYAELCSGEAALAVVAHVLRVADSIRSRGTAAGMPMPAVMMARRPARGILGKTWDFASLWRTEAPQQ